MTSLTIISNLSEKEVSYDTNNGWYIETDTHTPLNELKMPLYTVQVDCTVPKGPLERVLQYRVLSLTSTSFFADRKINGGKVGDFSD